MRNLIDQLGETLKTSANATVVRIDVDENEVSIHSQLLMLIESCPDLSFCGDGPCPSTDLVHSPE